jgi:hypothetical protein
MTWRPDRVLKIILIWTMITMVVVWLPLVRGVMDGDSYQWGGVFWGMQFKGSGVRGDYWVLVFQALFGITLLYLGWRGARQPFHWLLLLWQVPAALQACYDAFTNPEDYRFQGETLGVDISLAWVGPLVFGGVALLSLFWVGRDLKKSRDKTVVEWTRVNRIFLLIVLGLLPIQFVLLRFGEQHGPRDQVGVILTMLQWVMITLAMFPFTKRAGEVGDMEPVHG